MKQLLRDAWRAVTGKNPDSYRGFPKEQAERVSDSVLTLAEADVAFGEAVNAQQAGRLPEAQAAYRRILEHLPSYAPALHFLGVSCGQMGDFVEAERLIRQSLQIQESPESFNNLALAVGQLGKCDEVIVAYRNALRLAPDNVLMYCKLGDVLVEQTRYQEAEQAYRSALELRSDSADTHFALGAVLGELHQIPEAVGHYREALSLRPAFPDAYNNLGNMLRSMECFTDAEAAYRRALELRPDLADVHVNLGNLLCDVGSRQEAESAYRQALILRPGFAEAWSLLGSFLSKAGQLDEAEACHRKAISLKPDNALFNNALGTLFCQAKRYGEAEEVFRRALYLNPDCLEAICNLAFVLQEDGRIAEAEVLCRKSIDLGNHAAEPHHVYGRLLLETRRYTEAEEMLNRAWELKPNFGDACTQLGTLYKLTGRYAEAEAMYHRAIELQPKSAGVYNNLGLLLQGEQRFAEAEVAYRQSLMLDPDLDVAHYNWALCCLSQRKFLEGWEGYEKRWNVKEFNSVPRQFPQPFWQGQVIAGESLLVWQEQGVGDAVLYAGMVADLLAQNMQVILECESRLVPLFERSFAQAKVVAKNDPADAMTEHARWQSSLGSLGRWLRIQTTSFVQQRPYLKADPAKVAALRQRYQAWGQGPLIGISWRSSNEKFGAHKSMTLADWAPLLAIPGITFINLQYGDCDAEISQLKIDTGSVVHQDGNVNALRDLDGFSAQVAAMDLVISTSNSTVHFAGALGIPVWTLLPRGRAGLMWYWSNEGAECLWYSSMRLYRQEIPGDWPELISRISEALRGYRTAFV